MSSASTNLVALRAEADALRARLSHLQAEVARNDAILKKSQQRQLDLLRAGTLAELLKILIRGLKASYQLQAVSLALRDPDHEIRHLLWGEPVLEELAEELHFVGDLAQLTPSVAVLGRPWLGPYDAARHRLLFPEGTALASVALIPMRHHDAIEGVLMFGSADATRFVQNLATDFLQHLGLVAAMCLENGINRTRLLRSGFTDFLTGFYNRRYLEARLREELARVQRLGQTLAILMIDVDHFKDINDQFGHLAGDAVLREVARRIAAQMRTSDAGARFGGDEFALLLQQGGAADGERVAQRILNAVRAQPIAVTPQESRIVTLSVGVAAAEAAPVLRDHQALGERLIGAADAALYRAKNQGRNQVLIAESLVR
jgi:two-component system cell cycle response regulator